MKKPGRDPGLLVLSPAAAETPMKIHPETDVVNCSPLGIRDLPRSAIKQPSRPAPQGWNAGVTPGCHWPPLLWVDRVMNLERAVAKLTQKGAQ